MKASRTRKVPPKYRRDGVTRRVSSITLPEKLWRLLNRIGGGNQSLGVELLATEELARQKRKGKR